MKALKYIPLLLLPAIFSACESFNDLEEGALTPIPSLNTGNYNITVSGIYSSTITLESQGGSRDFDVYTSEGTTWKISDIPSWLTVSPQSGGGTADFTKVTISAEANTTSSPREAVLSLLSTVKDWTYKYQFTVEQPASDPFAKLNSDKFSYAGHYSEDISCAGTTLTFPVVTNCANTLNVVFKSGDETFEAQYNKSTGELTLQFPPNPSTSQRTFTLYLYNGEDLLDDYVFYQTSGEYGFVNSSGSVVYSYTRPESVSAFGETVILKASMVVPSQVKLVTRFNNDYSAAGQTIQASVLGESQEIKVVIPENLYTSSRTILVEMRSGDGSTLYSTAYITQDAPGVSLIEPTTTLDIDASSQSFEIKFDSTEDWSAVTSYGVDWVTLSPVGGSKGKGCVVTGHVTQNLSSYSRSCTITIQPVTGNNSKSFTLRQGAPGLTVSSTYFAVHENLPDNNGKLTITSSAPWSIKSKPDWATLSPAAGPAGVTDVELKVEYHAWVNGLQLREGDIVVQIDGTNITQSIKVRQYY